MNPLPLPHKREKFLHGNGFMKAVYKRTFACGTLYLQTFLERTGSAWTNIVNSLMELREPVFKVTQSSARDKFSKIIGNFRKKEARDAKASGVDVEYDKIAKGLTDIKNRMDEVVLSLQNNSAKKKKKAQEEKSQADDMRKKATAILESV